MRAIFDTIKGLLRKADGFWIDNAGFPIVVTGVLKPDTKVERLYLEDGCKVFNSQTPILLYGFYDYPSEGNYMNMFGIDAPDEMEIEFNEENVLKKLGMLPEIATVLRIEDATWTVIQRKRIYNRFIGRYRLSLTVTRYQESVTTGEGKVAKPNFKKKNA